MSDDDSIVVLNFDAEMSMPSVTAENTKNTDEQDTMDAIVETYSLLNLESKMSKSSNSVDNTIHSESGSSSQQSISINNGPSSAKLNLIKESNSFSEHNNKDISNIVQNGSSTEITDNNAKEPPANFNLNGRCTQGSLAADFLTGQIEKSSLEANILAHFPSISSCLVSNEEITKLQSFFSNYVELVETVEKNTNITKGYASSIQKWRNEVQAFKEEQVHHVKYLEETIAKLTNENLELKNDINSKMQNLKIVESVMKEENTEIIKQLSEKASHIEIMKNQIEALEQHQLGSYEYVKRKSESESNNGKETEYITTAEHNLVVKNLEREMSVLKAQVLQFEDMQNLYIDEMNCLKVQLTASEELLHQARADITILRNSDSEQCNTYEQYIKERDEMKQEIQLLKTQVDLYVKDFQTERTAKQLISNERDEILADLKLLQERNQKLIEEAEEMYELEKLAKSVSSSTSTLNKNGETGTKLKAQPRVQNTVEFFICPICGTKFSQFKGFENHVNACVDRTE